MARFGIRRLGYALGAEISGLDLSKPLDNDTFAELRSAWYEHIVLCFPGQELAPAEFAAFAGLFGELDDGSASPLKREGEVVTVRTLLNKPLPGGPAARIGERRIWHADRSHTVRPAIASFLNAQVLPSIGGDTMFANMYVAYETLSPRFQELIGPLEAIHDISVGNQQAFRGGDPDYIAKSAAMNPPVSHPIVRVHPETRRKSLYIGQKTRGIAGLTDEEARPLLDLLIRHATRYEFIYRHRWTIHDLVMWDNRCAIHYPVPDYDELRQMQRCSILEPVAATAPAAAAQAVAR